MVGERFQGAVLVGAAVLVLVGEAALVLVGEATLVFADLIRSEAYHSC